MRKVKKIICLIMFLVMGILPLNVLAVENNTFSKLFNEYAETLESFIKAFTSQDWGKAIPLAKKIEKQSKELMEVGEKDSNKLWLFDVTNLYHHSQELSEAAEKKDAIESVYLIGTLIAHIGYIQSANPLWLKDEVGKQIDVIEKGIKEKNVEMTRDAAEIVHTSANKIVLSSGLQREIYIHERFVEDIRKLNGWGDEIIEMVNGGNWNGPPAKLEEIKKAYQKWVKAFK